MTDEVQSRLAAALSDRYRIERELGRGGMATVFRARDLKHDRTVAIKVLRPDVARESGRVERRFRSEIRLARRVRHRNVCSMYGDGEDRGLRYICMELIEGENLARAARGYNEPPPTPLPIFSTSRCSSCPWVQ